MKNLILFIQLFLAVTLSAQTDPFNISIKSKKISGLGGIQSFAFGQHNGKWLLVGGRLDGLHRRQPWASFDQAGHNNQLIVVDPVNEQKWTASLANLNDSIKEQLSSTNMNFYQEGDYLYCVGGYGYSATEGDHTTYPFLTAIKVSAVIDSIINNKGFSSEIRQISDTKFQVTGGRLKKINSVYHLLGGQKFLGRYNPMNNPTFTQEYTNQIRRFTINDNGVNLTVNHLTPLTDAANLHRRDYNAEPQILPNGSEGITMFSGVFQTTVDLPFLNSVTVDSSNYSVNNTFQQYYNHYHCAVVPLYSVTNNAMHTLFFGGIAQYYDNNGVLTQDNDVPFVKTIARVTRDASGVMSEYKLPVEMPTFLGAGSEFIPNENLQHYNNGVMKLDAISEDSVLIGYIFGGINSSAKNIFWSNNGSQSSASNELFEVYLVKEEGSAGSSHILNEYSNSSLKLRVYPNPNYGVIKLDYQLRETENVTLKITDVNGKVLEDKELTNQQIGKNTFERTIKKREQSGVYFITLKTPYEKVTQKVIVQ